MLVGLPRTHISCAIANRISYELNKKGGKNM